MAEAAAEAAREPAGPPGPAGLASGLASPAPGTDSKQFFLILDLLSRTMGKPKMIIYLIFCSTINTISSVPIGNPESTSTKPKVYNEYMYNNKTNTLGLVLRNREVKLAKTIIESRIELDLNVLADDKVYDATLKGLTELMTKIHKYPIFRGTSRESKTLNSMIDMMNKKLDVITHQLLAMSHYHDKTAPKALDLDCKISVPAISLEIVEAARSELEEYLNDLNSTLTEDAIISAYSETHYLLFQSSNIITRLKDLTFEQLLLLENSANHIISDKLPLLLMTQPCIPQNILEMIDIERCDKVKGGLSCSLSVKAQAETQEMTLFTLINYDGAQLKLPPKDTMLLRSKDLHWSTAYCEDDTTMASDLEEFFLCKITAFDNACTNVLEEKNVNDLLTYCNFTQKEPERITTSPNGTLIQAKVTLLKELDPVTLRTAEVISPILPVFIKTNAILSITSGSQETLIKPSITHQNRELAYTWLSKEEIQRIKYAASIDNMVDNFERGDFIDFIMGILFLLMAPGSIWDYVYLLKTSKLASDCCSNKKTTKTKAKKENFKVNKKLLATTIM